VNRFDPTDNAAEVLVSLRDLFSHYPNAAHNGPEALSRLLLDQRLLPYEPSPNEVEAALEALVFEGRVLP
jgi:hypothetical protein